MVFKLRIMSSPIAGTQKPPKIKPCQKFEGHTDLLEGAIHLPGGQRMMTCSRDGSLRVWNLKNGKQVGEDWRDGDSGVWTIALSPDGKKVVSGSEDGRVRLWDMDTSKLITKWTGHTETVMSVCWSQDGERVVSGSYDGTVREWDMENGETILGPIKTGHEDVLTVVYSPDMTMFATGGYGPTRAGLYEHPVKIWNAKTGELVVALKGHTGSVMCLAWTPDGKTLISGSVDSSIRTWSTSNWKQIAVLDELEDTWNSVHGIAISPNGRILASALFDNTVRLWNLDNNKPISSPLNHANRVAAVSFSADGKLLATCCDDNNAYTWDVYAIFKKAGLEYLLLDKPDKSLLAQAHVSRRPVRRQPSQGLSCLRTSSIKS
ncbi:WD40-repeat-containing domain protein [Suillus subluteus]|nr:WD40-repeat-containing domain protein [Suillus subluteus]